MQEVSNALRAAGIDCKLDEPLKNHTSFKIGGPAALFVTPKTADEAAKAISSARTANVPCMLLGRGTNILFKDEGYAGVLVQIGHALGSIEIDGERVTAGAGADLSAVCRKAQQAGLAGLEFAFGIPGSVGGAVYMNAGAYGGEVKDILERVSYLDENGTLQTAGAEELALGYRESIFHTRPWCILSATFRLKPDNKDEIEARMQDFMRRREDKQPLDKPSAGSAFKRPPGAFAGALIDQCGLRGHSRGGAAISEKHCGFIVNMGGATCADVLALADEVCQTVKVQTGYTLEKEIRVIGRDGEAG